VALDQRPSPLGLEVILDQHDQSEQHLLFLDFDQD